MMGKGLHLILAIVLLSGLVGIVGCGEQEIASMDLVPQDANFMAGIQINKILADEDIAEAYNEAEKPPEWPQTFADALDWIEDEAGVDLRDFTDALIFGDIESGDYFGAIVKGTFNREALIDSVEEAIGEEMAISTYKGYQIYRMTIEEESAELCFLSGDTIVVGLPNVVKDVIDVGEGAPHLSGSVYDTYSALGDVWIKAALEVPEAAMGDISEWDVPIGMEAFEGMEAAGFGLNKEGENLSLQIKLYFSSAEAAADAEDMISGLLALLPLMMPEMPAEIADLLDGLSISRSGSWLAITLETTVAEIEGLIESGVSLPM